MKIIYHIIIFPSKKMYVAVSFWLKIDLQHSRTQMALFSASLSWCDKCATVVCHQRAGRDSWQEQPFDMAFFCKLFPLLKVWLLSRKRCNKRPQLQMYKATVLCKLSLLLPQIVSAGGNDFLWFLFILVPHILALHTLTCCSRANYCISTIWHAPS